MDWDSPFFIIAIITIATFGWVVTTAIRARYGYPLSDDEGNLVLPMKAITDEATKALAAENEQLKANVVKLEDRVKVLERIATDPAPRLENEIERLR